MSSAIREPPHVCAIYIKEFEKETDANEKNDVVYYNMNMSQSIGHSPRS